VETTGAAPPPANENEPVLVLDRPTNARAFVVVLVLGLIVNAAWIGIMVWLAAHATLPLR
jgi:hypothetical protein